MAIDTTARIHAETIKMDIHDVAKELVEALGPTLVATLAGVRDRKLPNKWAQAGGPTPRDESQSRLKTAHRVFRSLAAQEDAYIARSWFIGLNPLLEETSPIVALNEGREREVIEAARAFMEDDQTG